MKNKVEGAHCDKCPLRERPFVPAVGPEDAEILIVGEAPGENEIAKKEPFVGRSGRTFNRVLELLGIDRDTLRITNTVMCHPEGNATPLPDAVACCKERLDNEVKLHKTVITLGAVATNAITPAKTPMLKRRGWNTKTHFATMHPSYVNRNPDMVLEFSNDLAKAFGNERVKQATYVVKYLDKVEDIQKLLSDIHDAKSLTIDIETTGLNYIEDRIITLGLCEEPGVVYVLNAEPFYTNRSLRRQLEVVLEGCPIIAHNMKFEARFIKQQWNIELHLFFDTMLAHNSLDERKGTHGLKELAMEYLRAPDYGINTKGLESITEELIQYNAADVFYTHHLFKMLTKQLLDHPDSRYLFHEIMMPMLSVFIEMEENGMTIDEPYVKKLGKWWEDQVNTMYNELVDESGDPEFNPNSPIKLKDVLYNKMRYPVQYNKDGKVTTDREALEKLQEMQPSEFIEKLLHFRRLAKMLSTYIDNFKTMQDVHHRIHCNFLQHGTETGRPSSQDPNLLNVPKHSEEGMQVRNSFVSRPGMTFVQGDYSQQEVRVLAYYAKDPNLIEILSKEGADLHRETAKVIFGKDDVSKEERYAAKSVVFGIMYDMSARALAKKLGITEEQARKFMRTFYQKMPELQKWQNATVKYAFAKGYLETVFHRRRRFALITPDNASSARREAINFLIQGTSGDMTYMAILEMVHKVHRLGVLFVLTQYDSIMVECPDDKVKEVGRLIRDTMISTAEKYLPGVRFAVDIEGGKRWGELATLTL